ncbi:MAG: hypothetical protein ACTHXA_10935 [Gulosibacter sp.]|uniref:hypothetical protein n=1 Tax=Gulosibacter sp. TaxID=2817531 RepID=UPI003F8D9F60
MDKKSISIVGALCTGIVFSLSFPVVSTAESAVTIEDMIPLLTQPQTKIDTVPESVDLEALGNISSASVRLAGEDALAQYWIGLTEASEVCLIMHIPTSGISASTCGLATDFYSSGLGLVAGESRDDPSSSAEAYLLPFDIDSSEVGASTSLSRDRGVEGVNLVTVPYQANGLFSVDVERANGGAEFHFDPIRLDEE